MKVKRLLAVLLGLAMLVGTLPVISFAEKTAKLELVYMTENGGNYVESNKLDSYTVGTRFLVGVKASGFNTITGMGDGLFNLSTGVVFDPNYLTLEPSATHKTDGTITDSNFAKAFQDRTGFQDFINDGDGWSYDVTKVKTTEADATDLTGTFTANCNLAYGGEASSQTGTAPFYAAIYEFEVKAIPNGGKKVLDISKSAADFNLGMGSYGASTMQYDGSGEETDLSTVVDLKIDAVDIFPMPETPTNVELKSADPVNALVDRGTYNFSSVKLNATYKSGVKEKVPTAFYYGDAGATAVAGLTKVETTEKISKASMNGKTLYAVYTENGTDFVVAIGVMTVNDDTVSSIAVKTQPTLSYATDAAPDLSKLVVTLTYASGTTEDVAYANFTAKGLTVTINGAAVPAKMTTALNGKPFVITHTATSKTANTSNVTVADATVDTLTLGGTVLAAPEYGKTVEEILAGLTVSVKMSNQSSATTSAAGYDAVKAAVDSLIIKNASGNEQFADKTAVVPVGTYEVIAEKGTKTAKHATKVTVAPRKVTAAFTATVTKVYDGNNNVTTTIADVAPTNKVGTDDIKVAVSYKYNDKIVGTGKALTPTYTLKGNSAKNYATEGASITGPATGDITAKELTVANIGKVDAVKLGATGDALKVSGTYTVTTADGLVSGDKVTVAYEATYADASAANPNVSLTATLGALDGDDKVNYTLKSNSAAATGEVADKVLEAINVTAPTGSFTTDTGISLDTLVVTPVYDGAADAAEAKTGLADILAAGYTVTINDVPVEASPVMDIKEGANTIKVTKGSISGTATVTVGAGAIVPSAPEGAIDPATNYIKVKLPDNKSTLEYAIVKDGEAFDAAAATWTDGASFDGVFKGLAADTPFERDTKYVIMVRSKAIDGGAPASEAVPSEPVKTLKNHITIKNSSDKELSSIYTDADSAEDINALSNIIAKPSRWIGYYQEKELKTALTYPLTIETETIIFADIKQGSGSPISSGSSSRPTVSIKFSGPITAKVGDKPITLEPTIENTTSKPSYKSSDEKVVTVDANGEVTFVGEGKATITATVSGKTATVEVTVGPADEEKPTPTPPVIETTYAKAYIIGDEHGAFRPDAPITRAEVAAIFSRLAKMDENKTYAADYSDVEKGMWYTNYIGFLTSTGVLQGFGDEFNSFKPNNYITRAEMCAVISRAMNYKVSTEATSFEDVATAAPWAVYYVDTLHKAGVINGYSSTEFGADKNITRAETVTMINRLLEDGELATDNKPTDVNSTYWAYNDIIKAMNDKKIEEKAE
jgi:hypothetical protein